MSDNIFLFILECVAIIAGVYLSPLIVVCIIEKVASRVRKSVTGYGVVFPEAVTFLLFVIASLLTVSSLALFM